MQLTTEQQDILSTNSDLVINAVAGSGKTTTLIAYAQSRPANSRILYIAFNKTVKTEAQQKFTAAGLTNVKVETAHSLAYDYIVRHSAYKVVQEYKSHEWCDILGISTGDRHTDFIIGSHVSKFISYFCNSRANRVQELDYPSTIADSKAAQFVKNFYTQILGFTREALARMDKAEIGVTHDFYLKKFQLSRPKLPYDHILFDEGQDASAAMLDVFLNQPAVKLIVGDVHQQIYGWRYAINSLQQVDFPVYHLSNSFRFDDEIALVANKVLSWKKHLQEPPAVKLTGVASPSGDNTTKAVLGRTNLNLLLHAITKWQHGEIQSLFFEGNINSYTFADEGASLYDVLSLYNGRTAGIKDKLIAEMKSMRELEDYIDKTEDNSLAMIVDVVKEFGNELPSLISQLKTNHTTSKTDADMIFSTVHRCKGMEYDTVTLLNDFMTEEKLVKNIAQNGGRDMKEVDRNRLAEEVNILYVACTRARNKLIIPPGINPLRSIEIGEPPTPPALQPGKAYYRSPFGKERETSRMGRHESKFASQNGRWSRDEEGQLVEMFDEGVTVKDIAKRLDRSEQSIRRKLVKLGLMDEDDFF